MSGANKETPAGQGEGFEITPTPSKEHEVNENIIADTADAGESLAEWNARDRAEKAAWLVAHPEAVAAKPEWADQVGVEWEEEPQDVAITYERDFGAVLLSRWAAWENGVLTFDGGTTAPEVAVLLRSEILDVTQMRELASNLLAALPIVEQAQVTP